MLLKILYLILISGLATSFTKDAPLQHPASSPIIVSDTHWRLIFSDAKTKLYYTDVVCENVNALRLRIVNKGDDALNVSYKIWTSAVAKTISLFGQQDMEGICAPEYRNILLENIPAGTTVNDIKVTISYLP